MMGVLLAREGTPGCASVAKAGLEYPLPVLVAAILRPIRDWHVDEEVCHSRLERGSGLLSRSSEMRSL